MPEARGEKTPKFEYLFQCSSIEIAGNIGYLASQGELKLHLAHLYLIDVANGPYRYADSPTKTVQERHSLIVEAFSKVSTLLNSTALV